MNPVVVTRPERVEAIPGVLVALDAEGTGFVLFDDANAPTLAPFVRAARVSGGRYALLSPEGPHMGLASSDFVDALTGYAVTWREGILEPADRADGEQAAKYLDALHEAGLEVLGALK